MDPAIHGNYNPVSNLPFLEKMVERAVAEQFQTCLNDAFILDQFQSSFWPGNGTDMMLGSLTDDVWRHLSWGVLGLLLLLGLIEAFDTVD